MAFVFRVIDLNLYQHDFENFKHYTFIPVASNCWIMYVLLGTVYQVSLQKTHTELSRWHCMSPLVSHTGLVSWIIIIHLQKCSTELFKTAILILQLISWSSSSYSKYTGYLWATNSKKWWIRSHNQGGKHCQVY